MSSLVFSLIKALPKFDPTVFSLTGVTTLGKGSVASPWVILGGSPFDFAQFWAQLTYSLVLDRGVGSPTYSGGVATGSAIQDNEGVMRFRGANEAGFSGARRVKNIFTVSSEALTAANSWAGASVTATAASGSIGAVSLTRIQGTAADWYWGQGKTIAVGNRTVVSAWVASNTGSSQTFQLFGDSGGGVKSSGNLTATTTPQRFSWPVTVAIGTATVYGIARNVANDTADLLVGGMQLEDITGRTDQTTPSEYVSVGATPVNLCLQSEDFATTWTGAGAALIVTVNSTLAPNGTTTADTITKSGGSDQALNQVVTVVSGQTYTYSLYVLKDATVSRFPEFYLTDAGANQLYTDLNTSTGANVNRIANGTVSATVEDYSATYWRIKLTALSGAASMSVGFRPAACTVIGTFSAAATGAIIAWGAQLQLGSTATTYIPTTTVAKAYGEYHGLGVDGVQDFPTDLTGAPIPLTTLKGYQAEPAATNKQIQSQFASGWSVGSASQTINNAIAPDGTLTACLVTSVGASSNASHYATATTAQGAGSVTDSVFIKAGSSSWVAVICSDLGANSNGKYFNLGSGTVGGNTGLVNGANVTAPSGVITPMANGWYRCQLTVTVTAASYSMAIYVVDGDNSLSVTAGKTLYDWGAQSEAGSVATSYIPTTTGSVTRAADVLTYPLAENIDGTQGWCYAEVSVPIPTLTTVSTVIGSAGGYPLYIDSSSKKYSLYDGATESIFSAAQTFPINSIQKVSSFWGGSKSNGSLNGVLGTEANFDGDIGLSGTLTIGCLAAGTSVLKGTIRNVRVGLRKLSNSEDQAITT
ncbi:hypothetical protein UFOVP1590_16 [uncultured Caudovirales phage]|uniref:Concanavalin A-like lectin/glucanases superfamily n=1 Tax=uncultured Caudovirales phage TaxID=2100421 RepID=A0A6J5SN07_9CAUD|nr:hypothetical protein UFOVP1590_16 [uncultured Caudovirales phage]